MTGFLAEIGAMIVGLDQFVVDVLVSIRDPAITKVMNSVTGLGSATAAAVIIGLLSLADSHEEVATAILSFGLAGPVVLTLMGLVQRPFPANPVCVTNGEMVAHSFPCDDRPLADVSRNTLPLGYARRYRDRRGRVFRCDAVANR